MQSSCSFRTIVGFLGSIQTDCIGVNFRRKTQCAGFETHVNQSDALRYNVYTIATPPD